MADGDHKQVKDNIVRLDTTPSIRRKTMINIIGLTLVAVLYRFVLTHICPDMNFTQWDFPSGVFIGALNYYLLTR